MSVPLLFTPDEFLEDFLKEAARAKKSIYLQSMNFEAGDALTRIEEVLTPALERGVRVNITIDWVSRLFIHGQLPLLPGRPSKRAYRDRHVRESEALRDRLEAMGATFVTTNKPSFFNRPLPMIRRNHIKLYMVDEAIAWMGGVNLFDDAFKKIDLMVRFEDEEIVHALHQQFFMVNRLRSVADYSKKLGEDYTLYVDTGRLEQSIIYRQAIKRVSESSLSITFMSQFIPDGPLLKELIAASKRGVKIEVLTSRRNNVIFTKYPTKAVYDLFKFKIKNYPLIKLVHLSRDVHAKLLIIDEKIALFGSHNYTYSGVLFGTEEIMMETRSDVALKQFFTFLSDSKNREN